MESQTTSALSKTSWKRIELAVNRFIKTSETDFARIQQLKKNVIEFEKNGDRNKVKAELMKARQTIEQLENNFCSLQSIRSQVHEDDLRLCDERFNEVGVWLKEEIDKFTNIDQDLIDYFGSDFKALFTAKGEDYADNTSNERPENALETKSLIKEAGADFQATKEQEEQVKAIAQDVQDIHDMMSQLQHLVQDQHERVECIESNVETAHDNVKQAGLKLNQASVLKTAGFAVVGAVCGALVGGPIGVLAGAKIGAVAAGAGMAVGALAGRKVKQMKQKQSEVELQNLNAAADMAQTKEFRRELLDSCKS